MEMSSGFVNYDGGIYYVGENGALALNWVEFPEAPYHFDYMTGRMHTGWYYGAAAYWLGEDGAVKTGWQEIGGNRYYFTASGDMVTGDILIRGIPYKFGEDGVLQDSCMFFEIEQGILQHD